MADNFTGWPEVVNDDGSLSYGTPFSRELMDALRAAIADNLYSAANPTIKLKDLIAEVVAARDGQATLLARIVLLQASIDSITPGGGGGGGAASGSGVNWVMNDDFIIWPRGDSGCPAGYRWSLLGGSVIARAGVGLTDTHSKVGPYCVRLTRAAGVDNFIQQRIMNSTSFTTSGAFFKTTKFIFGSWIWASAAGQARVRFQDGVGFTTGLYLDGVLNPDEDGYHPGDSAWHFLSGERTIDNAATFLEIDGDVFNVDGDAYFSGMTAMPGAGILAGWTPCPKSITVQRYRVVGNVALADHLDEYRFERPAIVRNVSLICKTAPATTPIIVNVNHWDGSAWTSMFSTRPQIAASAKFGQAQPDAAYRYRCFTGGNLTPSIIDQHYNIDVEGIGTGTVGADLFIEVSYLQYMRPQESLLDALDAATSS